MPRPKINRSQTPDFRTGYANSTTVRANLWDFYFEFGTATVVSPEELAVVAFQGLYLSPPQVKALVTLLAEHVRKYEETFGEIPTEAKYSMGALQ